MANITGAVSAPARVTISVRAKSPVAVSDTGSVVAGEALLLDLAGERRGVRRRPTVGTTVILSDAPAGVSVDDAGVLTGRPPRATTGDFAFAYRVADTEGNVSNQTSITVFLFAKPRSRTTTLVPWWPARP